MKNLVFGLIAAVMFITSSNAQEKIDFNQSSVFKSATLTTKINNEKVDYKFHSLAEFNEGFDQIIDQTDFSNPENLRAGEKCEVTIQVTVEVTVGLATITMSGSVTTTCANAAAAAKKLRNMLINAAMG